MRREETKQQEKNQIERSDKNRPLQERYGQNFTHSSQFHESFIEHGTSRRGVDSNDKAPLQNPTQE